MDNEGFHESSESAFTPEQQLLIHNIGTALRTLFILHPDCRDTHQIPHARMRGWDFSRFYGEDAGETPGNDSAFLLQFIPRDGARYPKFRIRYDDHTGSSMVMEGDVDCRNGIPQTLLPRRMKVVVNRSTSIPLEPNEGEAKERIAREGLVHLFVGLDNELESYSSR